MAAPDTNIIYAFARDKGVMVLPDRNALTVGMRDGADPYALL